MVRKSVNLAPPVFEIWLRLHFLISVCHSSSLKTFLGIIPFLTDWSSHDSLHASAKLPIVGTLTNVTVTAPGDHVLHKFLESPTNLDMNVGSEKLEFTIKSKNGNHTFTSTSPVGISFPEEGGIEVK